MTPLLLDTQAFLWLVGGHKRLGPKSRKLAEAVRSEGQLFVSAISFWEMTNLAEINRIKLGLPVLDWRARMLCSGIREWQLDGRTAIRASELLVTHPDPFDRFILATAEIQGASLMTSDHVLLKWRSKMKRFDATE